ncbi:MAG: hypothetical protein QW478_06050 [Candidatus Micrarchaeaceae archaeon]
MRNFLKGAVWDYGDWINWFGNMSAVLRGDNQVPTLDYQVAYLFTRGNYTQLADFMKQNNAKFLLFSSDDLGKWEALNYLGCIYINGTNTSVPIGTSACETSNSPIYLITQASPTSLSAYCTTISNSTETFLKAVGTNGNVYCIPTNYAPFAGGEVPLFNETSPIPYSSFIPYQQNVTIGNTLANIYLLLINPLNTTTCTMPSNLPSTFYNSPYYKLFMMGCTGNQFTQVYPSGNGFGAVRIWEVNASGG